MHHGYLSLLIAAALPAHAATAARATPSTYVPSFTLVPVKILDMQ